MDGYPEVKRKILIKFRDSSSLLMVAILQIKEDISHLHKGNTKVDILHSRTIRCKVFLPLHSVTLTLILPLSLNE
jgi:hypothetical protein